LESSTSSGAVWSSLRSTETSPTDESGTKLVAHMDSMADNKDFIATQEGLYQRHVEGGCDLFIDPNYVRWLRLYHPELCSYRSISQRLIISHI